MCPQENPVTLPAYTGTLTPAHRQLITGIRDEWAATVLCAAPLDRAVTVEAVRCLNDAHRLSQPSLTVWMDSPLGCIYAAAVIGQPREQLREQFVNKFRHHQLQDQVGGQLWPKLARQIRDQLGDRLGTRLRNPLRSQLEEQLGSQLHGQLNSQLWAQLRGRSGASSMASSGIRVVEGVLVEIAGAARGSDDVLIVEVA
jgi:hypothetical protein